jgi:dihydrofolate synthase/folylpolyglutamate synthase
MIFSQDILEYIKGLEKRGWRLGLDRIKAACLDLENPQNAYPIVIVAGTNGKGSVSCILQKLTRAHGLKTGLYSSPSLKSLNERIVVNGEAIPEAEFKSLALRLVKISEKHSLSQFEFLTLMAFEHFRAARIAIAVVEVGMGGRLDATNAVDASTAIITPIGIDHSEHLGADVAMIALEKSGVIKRDATVVCAQQDRSASEVIRKAVAENDARMMSYGEDFRCIRRHPSELATPEVFDYRDWKVRLDSLELGLRGVFQPSNASLAFPYSQRDSILN